MARVDHPELLKVIEVAFAHLGSEQKLWPASSQTMRARFQRLLKASSVPQRISRGIDLGLLRAGGASWLLMTSENSELTRRRGWWISTKMMEIYVQEAWSVQFMPRLPGPVKMQTLNGVTLFPWALDLVQFWRKCAFPDTIWPVMFHQAAKDFELKHLGRMGVGKAARWLCVDSCPAWRKGAGACR